jgi:hypothetical protein
MPAILLFCNPTLKPIMMPAYLGNRHPHHRQPHTWLPLTEVENLDEASKGQRVRAEFDHRIAASEELLRSIQASQRLLVAQQVAGSPTLASFELLIHRCCCCPLSSIYFYRRFYLFVHVL